jgi:hypothetical protein
MFTEYSITWLGQTIKAPVKEGYTFNGWSDADGDVDWDEEA